MNQEDFLDYYEILEIPITATTKEILDAYTRLVPLYHPYNHPDDPNALDKFNRIIIAKDVLTDPIKRREYDTEMKSRLQGKQRNYMDELERENEMSLSIYKSSKQSQGSISAHGESSLSYNDPVYLNGWNKSIISADGNSTITFNDPVHLNNWNESVISSDGNSIITFNDPVYLNNWFKISISAYDNSIITFNDPVHLNDWSRTVISAYGNSIITFNDPIYVNDRYKIVIYAFDNSTIIFNEPYTSNSSASMDDWIKTAIHVDDNASVKFDGSDINKSPDNSNDWIKTAMHFNNNTTINFKGANITNGRVYFSYSINDDINNQGQLTNRTKPKQTINNQVSEIHPKSEHNIFDQIYESIYELITMGAQGMVLVRTTTSVFNQILDVKKRNTNQMVIDIISIIIQWIPCLSLRFRLVCLVGVNIIYNINEYQTGQEKMQMLAFIRSLSSILTIAAMLLSPPNKNGIVKKVLSLCILVFLAYMFIIQYL